MDKLKVLVRGPALTRSGYGHNVRFLLRALRTKEEFLDLYLVNTNWGQTGWLHEENEERLWLDQLIRKTALHQQQFKERAVFDVSYQVTIPQEWEKLAAINIGYTAGVETTQMSPLWVQKSNEMNRINVVSNHARYAFDASQYEARNNDTGEIIPNYKVETPIDVINYGNELPDREIVVPMDLKDRGITTEFNFLTFAQWGPRKNIENTILGFVEAFRDRSDVGLIVKTFQRNYSYADKFYTEKRLKNLLKSQGLDQDRNCKIYFLHGEMSELEIAALYCSKQVHAFINIAHGEGFGLPIFEAATYGVPIITIPWGGQCDFLYRKEDVTVKIPAGLSAKEKKKFKKTKTINRPMFTEVQYDLNNIQKEAVWENVLLENSKWAFPKRESYAAALRRVASGYSKVKAIAEELEQHILTSFTKDLKYSEIINSLCEALPQEHPATKQFKIFMLEDITTDTVFCADVFADQYEGGAELSFQTIVDSCPNKDTSIQLKSSEVNGKLLEKFKDASWIFGNIADLSMENMQLLLDNNISYNFIEFDYKICEYRNPALHFMLEDEDCACEENEDRGPLYKEFYKSAKNVFFMSDKQREYFENKLSLENGVTLSSIFDAKNLDMLRNKIKALNDSPRADRGTLWAIPGSHFWVKGNKEAKEYCKENNLEFLEIKDMTRDKVLDALVDSCGFVCLPPGEDTCPRLAIEARLLGCELVLGENVLHKDEVWFNQESEKILEYLESVSERFWTKVSS